MVLLTSMNSIDHATTNVEALLVSNGRLIRKVNVVTSVSSIKLISNSML